MAAGIMTRRLHQVLAMSDNAPWDAIEREAVDERLETMSPAALTEFFTGNPSPLYDSAAYCSDRNLGKLLSAAILGIKTCSGADLTFAEEMLESLVSGLVFRCRSSGTLPAPLVKSLVAAIQSIDKVA
jgi:hypothetical protein